MDPTKSIRNELLKRVKNLHLEFDSCVRSFEQQDLNKTTESAESILENINKTLNDLAADYRNALLSGRLSDLENDQVFIDSLKKEGKPKNSKDIMPRLIRLEKYIKVLEKETNRIYPRPPVFLPFFYRYKQPLLIVLGILLATTIGMTAWSAIQGRRQGLVGRYYGDINFSDLYKERLDHQIDFNFDLGSPLHRWKKDKFSIRWTGYIFIPSDGIYEFLTNSDDGVRLVIGKEQIINNWTVHAVTTNRGSIALQMGYHPITLEYYEQQRRAQIRLLWKPEFQTHASLVPAKFLCPKKEFLKPNLPMYEGLSE